MRDLALIALLCAAVAAGCAPTNRPDLALLADEACTRMTGMGHTAASAMLKAAAAEARRDGYSDDAFHQALENRCPSYIDALDQAGDGLP